jgi:hypothetical protein
MLNLSENTASDAAAVASILTKMARALGNNNRCQKRGGHRGDNSV